MRWQSFFGELRTCFCCLQNLLLRHIVALLRLKPACSLTQVNGNKFDME